MSQPIWTPHNTNFTCSYTDHKAHGHHKGTVGKLIGGIPSKQTGCMIPAAGGKSTNALHACCPISTNEKKLQIGFTHHGCQEYCLLGMNQTLEYTDEVSSCLGQQGVPFSLCEKYFDPKKAHKSPKDNTGDIAIRFGSGPKGLLLAALLLIAWTL